LLPVVPDLLSVVPDLFPVVPDLLPVVPDLFPVVPDLFPVVPDLFSVIPDLFSVVPDLFSVVPDLFSVVPDLFSVVPDLFPVIPDLLPVIPDFRFVILDLFSEVPVKTGGILPQKDNRPPAPYCLFLASGGALRRIFCILSSSYRFLGITTGKDNDYFYMLSMDNIFLYIFLIFVCFFGCCVLPAANRRNNTAYGNLLGDRRGENFFTVGAFRWRQFWY
jgi:hypothetical protein